MHRTKTTEEVEDALFELVLLRTRHCGDDPALAQIDEWLATSEPLSETEHRRQLKELFNLLWRHRPPLVLKVIVVGEQA